MATERRELSTGLGGMPVGDELRLREMMPDDAEALSALHRQIDPSPWNAGHFAHACVAPGRGLVLCEETGDLAGFVVSILAAGQAEILALGVAPEFRRRGWGRFLLHRMIRTLPGRIDDVFLEVRASNLAAAELYHRSGFKTVGVRQAYYRCADGAREDALVMRLTLSSSETPG